MTKDSLGLAPSMHHHIKVPKLGTRDTSCDPLLASNRGSIECCCNFTGEEMAQRSQVSNQHSPVEMPSVHIPDIPHTDPLSPVWSDSQAGSSPGHPPILKALSSNPSIAKKCI
jgi:hypothetical protein